NIEDLSKEVYRLVRAGWGRDGQSRSDWWHNFILKIHRKPQLGKKGAAALPRTLNLFCVISRLRRQKKDLLRRSERGKECRQNRFSNLCRLDGPVRRGNSRTRRLPESALCGNRQDRR